MEKQLRDIVKELKAIRKELEKLNTDEPIKPEISE